MSEAFERLFDKVRIRLLLRGPDPLQWTTPVDGASRFERMNTYLAELEERIENLEDQLDAMP